MRTEQIKIYKFEELSEKSKQKAIENFRDSMDYVELQERADDFTHDLSSKGFDNAKVWYSVSCSQGDGACFDADIDIDQVVGEILDNPCHPIIRKTLKDFLRFNLSDELRLKIITTNYHYSHENCRRVEAEYYVCDEKYSRVARCIENTVEAIENYRQELCQEIYAILYNELEYITSDEYIQECIECNEYEFLENGDFY